MAWSTCCSVTGVLLEEEQERAKMEFLELLKCRVGKNLVWGRTSENSEEAAIAIVMASVTFALSSLVWLFNVILLYGLLGLVFKSWILWPKQKFLLNWGLLLPAPPRLLQPPSPNFKKFLNCHVCKL